MPYETHFITFTAKSKAISPESFSLTLSTAGTLKGFPPASRDAGPEVPMGLVGSFAPCGLSQKADGVPVIHEKDRRKTAGP